MSRLFRRLRRGVAIAVSAAVASTLAVVAAPAVSAAPVGTEVNIRLSDADKATMTDKSYWWTNEPASHSYVKFVEAGGELVLNYTVTDMSGFGVSGATLTLNAIGNGTFTGALSAVTDSSGRATFTLRNTVANADAEPRPVAPSSMTYFDDSRGGFNEVKYDLNPTIGAGNEHVDRVWTHTVKAESASATTEANIFLSAADKAQMTNKDHWWTNAGSHSWVKFVEAGATLNLTYTVTDMAGTPLAGKTITLKTGAINRASFTGNLTATTDAGGTATFTLTNTTNNDDAEPRPVEPSTMSYWDDSRGATLGGVESTYNFEPTIGYDIEHVDRVWTHTVKAEVVEVAMPAHVNIRLIEPAMDYASNAFDATEWMKPWIDSDSRVFLTYLDAGSTTSFKYRATDAATGAAVANKGISIVVNANWSCSNASFEVNGITAAPDWCDGNGQTSVQGVTDANGEVIFSVKSTNSEAEAEERPSAFNQPSDKWSAGERKSNIQVTMGAQRESIDIVFGHIVKPAALAQPPAVANIRLSDADTAHMANKSYWWTNEPQSRSWVKFVTAGDSLSVTYIVTDGDGKKIANLPVTLRCLGGSATFSGCTDGQIVKSTNANGEVTFSVVSTTAAADAEPRPVAPSSMDYWDDSRVVSSESTFNFEPTVGSPVEHIDRIWTHTVKPAASNVVPLAYIYLSDADKATMTDKSYWWTNEPQSRSLVKFVAAGSNLTLNYRVTDGNGNGLANKSVTLNTAPGGGCFTGTLSGTTDANGYVTFSLTSCTDAANAEPAPVAPSTMSYWDDSRVVSPEVKFDFWPTIGASVEHIDRVWTHTVKPEELTIRLSEEDTASMTDKSYWWTNEPASRSLVKFVTAGDTLTLNYRVTSADGPVAGRTVTLNSAPGGGCFTGDFTGTTDDMGYVTFSLENCTSNDAAEPRPVAPSSMSYWDDSRVVSPEVKYDFWPTAGASIEHIDRVWTHTVKSPDPVAPDAISSVSVTPGDRMVSVSWDAPFDGYSEITGYAVTVRLHTGASKTSVIKRFTLDGYTTSFDYDQVNNGLTFSFTVAAMNAIGTAPATTSDRVIPGTPGAPTIDNITAANGKLTVEFSPGDSGAADIRYYSYSINGGVTGVISRKNTGSPIVISKLTNGQTYQVVVRAHNKYGAGAMSEIVEATPVPDAPKAPRVSRVSASSSEITVTVKPGYNGGAEITDYEYSLDGGDSWNSVGAADTTFTIGGLEPSTIYSLSVRAVNEAGASDGSTPRNVKTRRG